MKFFIFKRSECCKMPIVQATNTEQINQLKECGYKIVGGISGSERFIPKFAITGGIK